MSGRPWVGATLVLATTLSLGCATSSEPATALVLAVDTDLAASSRADRLVVQWTVDDAPIRPVVREATAELGGELGLPAHVVLLPVREPLDDPTVSLDTGPITVSAFVDRELVVSQHLLTRFVPGSVKRLDVFLGAACVGVTCNDATTCRESRCGSRTIDATGLPDWDGGSLAALVENAR